MFLRRSSSLDESILFRWNVQREQRRRKSEISVTRSVSLSPFILPPTFVVSSSREEISVERRPTIRSTRLSDEPSSEVLVNNVTNRSFHLGEIPAVISPPDRSFCFAACRLFQLLETECHRLRSVSRRTLFQSKRNFSFTDSNDSFRRMWNWPPWTTINYLSSKIICIK